MKGGGGHPRCLVLLLGGARIVAGAVLLLQFELEGFKRKRRHLCKGCLSTTISHVKINETSMYRGSIH